MQHHPQKRYTSPASARNQLYSCKIKKRKIERKPFNNFKRCTFVWVWKLFAYANALADDTLFPTMPRYRSFPFSFAQRLWTCEFFFSRIRYLLCLYLTRKRNVVWHLIYWQWNVRMHCSRRVTHLKRTEASKAITAVTSLEKESNRCAWVAQ